MVNNQNKKQMQWYDNIVFFTSGLDWFPRRRKPPGIRTLHKRAQKSSLAVILSLKEL
jgi:hypothetical protein